MLSVKSFFVTLNLIEVQNLVYLYAVKNLNEVPNFSYVSLCTAVNLNAVQNLVYLNALHNIVYLNAVQ